MTIYENLLEMKVSTYLALHDALFHHECCAVVPRLAPRDELSESAQQTWIWGKKKQIH